MRSEFKRNFSLLLLVLTLAISALLLAVSNGFLARVGDVSVADDCSSAGAVCDGNGCRLDKGEQWCACENQCINTTGPYARQCGCQGGGGGNPTPPGNNCPTSAPTHPGCYGKPVNSSQTYGGVAGKCVINKSPHCAFVTASTPTPPPYEEDPGDTPSLPTGPVKCSSTEPAKTICNGKSPGDYVNNGNCRCNAACNCVGEYKGQPGERCVGDTSCVSGICDDETLRCMAKSDSPKDKDDDGKDRQQSTEDSDKKDKILCENGTYCGADQYCVTIKNEANGYSSVSTVLVCMNTADVARQRVTNPVRFASGWSTGHSNIDISREGRSLVIIRGINRPLNAFCKNADERCDSGNGSCVLVQTTALIQERTGLREQLICLSNNN